MKVALYARVSKLRSHQDPEVQLGELRTWCTAHKRLANENFVKQSGILL